MSSDFDIPCLVPPTPFPPLTLIRILLPPFNNYAQEMSDEETSEYDFIDSPPSPPFELVDGSVAEAMRIGG